MASRLILLLCMGLVASATTPKSAAAAARAGGQAPSASGDSVRPRNTEPKQATGYVTETVCSGAGQRIELKTSSGTLRFRGPASGGLAIEDSAQLPEGFNSCTSLKGLRISVQYTPDDSRGPGGTIKSLRLLPPEDVNSAEGPLTPVSSTPSIGDSHDSSAPLVPDAHMTAEGRVADVTCTGSELLVKIVAASRQFTLHARDYTRLTFDDDRKSFEDPDFPACTQLKGRVAAIEFIVVEHRSYDGEMWSIEIER